MDLHPSLARQWANTFPTRYRSSAPVLPVAFTLDTLLEWLQWNDRNGEYTDPPSDAPLWTMEDAVGLLCEMAGDSWVDFISNPEGYPVTVAGFLQWVTA